MKKQLSDNQTNHLTKITKIGVITIFSTLIIVTLLNLAIVYKTIKSVVIKFQYMWIGLILFCFAISITSLFFKLSKSKVSRLIKNNTKKFI